MHARTPHRGDTGGNPMASQLHVSFVDSRARPNVECAAGNAVAREKDVPMKPLVVRSQGGLGQSPVKAADKPQAQPGKGKSGEGAASALEQLAQQERARVLG